MMLPSQTRIRTSAGRGTPSPQGHPLGQFGAVVSPQPQLPHTMVAIGAPGMFEPSVWVVGNFVGMPCAVARISGA